MVPGVPDDVFARGHATGRLTFATDTARPRRLRRGADLRADAGRREPAGPALRHLGRPGGGGGADAGDARRAREHDLPRHHRGGGASAARGPRPARRPRLPARLLARARRPGQRQVRPAQHPSGGGWPHARGGRGGRRVLPPARRRGPGRLRLPERRDGQAPREHLPDGQHRPGQRARDGVRGPGHRRVGGHRRGGLQAVRVHALRPRARHRRPLHPARPDVPDLAVAARHRHARCGWSRRPPT